MRKLYLFVLLSFCRFAMAAENDPPAQDAGLQEVVQTESDISIESQEDGSDLIAAEILDTNEDEESFGPFYPDRGNFTGLRRFVSRRYLD